MQENDKKFWLDFIEMGYKVRKNPTGKIQFQLENVWFELEYAEATPTSEWFRLYKVEVHSTTTSKTMFGSDYYCLGRKDIHDMADDGVRHLTLARQEH